VAASTVDRSAAGCFAAAEKVNTPRAGTRLCFIRKSPFYVFYDCPHGKVDDCVINVSVDVFCCATSYIQKIRPVDANAVTDAR